MIHLLIKKLVEQSFVGSSPFYANHLTRVQTPVNKSANLELIDTYHQSCHSPTTHHRLLRLYIPRHLFFTFIQFNSRGPSSVSFGFP
ncbi:hypothetical protein L1887_18651 [Cichorium endivia]|nr:hypothetical protein L1887_18651 [Cichorium endivia]